MKIRKKNGEEFSDEVTFPKGHYYNPMTVDDVNAKFDDACDTVVEPSLRDEIRSAWWNFEEAPDLSALIGLLANYS